MKSTLSKAILDTNLLLLWLIARTDVSLLRSFKRVRAFTYQDIDLLRDVLKIYPDLITTPHVLCETSNFVDQAPAWHRERLIEELKAFILGASEIYIEAQTLTARDEYNRLGLTDTALAHLSAEVMVITLDYQLAGKIAAMGGNTLNFNHHRSGLLLSQKH